MLYFLLAVPGVLLFAMVFLLVSKICFTSIEIIIGSIVSLLLVVSVVLFLNHLFSSFLLIDVVGNLAFAGCLTVLSWRKTNDWLQSAFFALLTIE